MYENVTDESRNRYKHNLIYTIKYIFIGFQKAVGESLAGAILGTQNFVKALRIAIAEEVVVMGTKVIAHGLASMATGLWPFNQKAIASGLKQVAMGAGIVAIGKKIAPAGS